MVLKSTCFGLLDDSENLLHIFVDGGERGQDFFLCELGLNYTSKLMGSMGAEKNCMFLQGTRNIGGMVVNLYLKFMDRNIL